MSDAPRQPDLVLSGSLGDDLRSLIEQDGPISVARFMALALGHPRHGYYMTRDPFGAAGDFTTAPEISQMFGELLGLWAAHIWHAIGRPDPLRLVELGPGRGTLMADALRAARALPGFRDAADVHLVETSPVLRAAQERTLAAQGVAATWHDTIAGLPSGPAIVIGNEFFDALPIRQFQRTARGWCERLVGLGAAGGFTFGLSGRAEEVDVAPAPIGAIAEVCPAGLDIMHTVAARIAGAGGALLVIDYGSVVPFGTPTLQAVKSHRFVDPLAEPGAADLTAHVDFAALARVARNAGAVVHGPETQGRFLLALGLRERADALRRRATSAQAAAIDAAVSRLAGPEPGMGDLFKVLAVTASDQPAPPGFAVEPRS